MFVKRETTIDQQSYEKMLSVISHQWIANQNHNEMSLQPITMAISQKTASTKCC